MKTLVLLLTFTTCAFSQLIGEARILKEKRDAKIAEIEKVYLGELEKLKFKELERRNMEAYEAIEKELGKVEDPLTSIVGHWVKSIRGMRYNHETLVFTDRRFGMYKGKELFKTSYNSATKKIMIESAKWKNNLVMTTDTDKMIAVNDDGSEIFQLVRVR